MTIRFPKGKHRGRPLYWLRWWPLRINPRKIVRRVTFTHDSKYVLPETDQPDRNKLFGVSFGGVHRNSARFCFWYNPGNKKFYLSAYVYINGERYFEDLCECVANHYYDCSLIISDSEYFFIVNKENGDVAARMAFSKGHKRKWAILLGPWFGGNRPAPHTITLQLKKL